MRPAFTRVSNILTIVLRFLCGVIGAVCVLMALVYFWLLLKLLGPGFPVEALGPVLAEALGEHHSYVWYIGLAAAGIFDLVCLFLAVFYAQRLFACVRVDASPFTMGSVALIRKIALWTLLYALTGMVPLIEPSQITHGLTGAVFALILYSISLVFAYGCGLQQEVDETL